jgi:hypothetical protein
MRRPGNVTCSPDIHKFGTPGIGKLTRAVNPAIRIIIARDHDRRKWQPLHRNRHEIPQLDRRPSPFNVRRSHQKSCRDLARSTGDLA